MITEFVFLLMATSPANALTADEMTPRIQAPTLSAQEMNKHCVWYARRSAKVGTDLSSLTSGKSCKLSEISYLCTGDLKCDLDFSFNHKLLGKNILNPVSCLQKQSCDEVSVSDCFQDKLTSPMSDTIEPYLKQVVPDGGGTGAAHD